MNQINMEHQRGIGYGSVVNQLAFIDNIATSYDHEVIGCIVGKILSNNISPTIKLWLVEDCLTYGIPYD